MVTCTLMYIQYIIFKETIILKSEYLSLNLQKPHKELDIIACDYNPSIGKWGQADPWILLSMGLAKNQWTSSLLKDTVSKNKSCEWKDKTLTSGLHKHMDTHAQTAACTCIHVKLTNTYTTRITHHTYVCPHKAILYTNTYELQNSLPINKKGSPGMTTDRYYGKISLVSLVLSSLVAWIKSPFASIFKTGLWLTHMYAIC